MPNFQDDDHALHAGMLAGALMHAGFQVIIELDEQQSHTPYMTIVFPGDRFVDELAVHIRVLSGEPERPVQDSV